MKSLPYVYVLGQIEARFPNLLEVDADYLDACRKKRNETEYDFAGNVSEDEVQELLDFCQELKIEVKAWLRKITRSLFKR
ncbi:hypothetical protein [Methanothrix soehngenii]|uniref:hypothetical protein n=1 Tax=Methanothrix soehngenii TaxID=2223 RepID=UPI00300CE802